MYSFASYMHTHLHNSKLRLYHDDRYLDKVNLMAYDFFGGFDNRTNPHSPLYAGADMLMPDDRIKNVVRTAIPNVP